MSKAVVCAVDKSDGSQIPGGRVTQGIYLTWARPTRKSDAHDNERFATNDLASDLIMFGNRARDDWADQVVNARAGNPHHVSERVVTGPAIVLFYDSQMRRHVHVKPEIFVWPKMGNALLPSVFNSVEVPPPPHHHHHVYSDQVAILSSSSRHLPPITAEKVELPRDALLSVSAESTPVLPSEQSSSPPSPSAHVLPSENVLPEEIPLVHVSSATTDEKEIVPASSSSHVKEEEEESPSKDSPAAKEPPTKRTKRQDIAPATGESLSTGYQTRSRNGIRKVNSRYVK